MPKINFQNMGAGLNLDGFPNELAPSEWSGGQNIRFRDGYAEKSQGDVRVHGDLLAAPYGLFPTQGITGRYWVYAGLQTLSAVENNTHTDITRAAGLYTGTVDNRWNGGVLSGVLVVNNCKDVPQFWGGNPAVKAADLTAWPSTLRAKVIRPFRNFLFALNLTDNGAQRPYALRWSHPADPGTLPVSWDIADPTKDAGEFDLADTSDVIVDAVPLGQALIVYKENSIWQMDYVGSPYIWSSKPVVSGVGLLAQDCVVPHPGGHIVLTQGDVVNFDGSTAQSVADGRVRRWLFDNLNADMYQRSFAVGNYRRNEAWICVPRTGSDWPDTALIFNWKDATWAIRDLAQASAGASGTIVYDLGNSWDADPDPWDTDDTSWNQYEYTQASPRLMLASAASQRLVLVDTGKTFQGAAMVSRFEKTGMSFDAPERIKYCKSVRPRIEAQSGTTIDIYVGAQEDLENAVEWSGPVPFVVGQDLSADIEVSGRYLSVRFESSGIVSWRMKQFDIDVTVLGGY
ncbi:hypothetical protein RA224_13030 [Achromobacter aegrifaciens]|uniref:hypothetical protein n=1 Tax=Achromobacter aegrifaciens TaxID=1287736 RepID=UPI0027BA2100|nr:hypothetical protein [Achromobacter aegrifaciens]WLW64309.1 hypothetical protein RA224_13030 [Achromobacter aegrifaciens]